MVIPDGSDKAKDRRRACPQGQANPFCAAAGDAARAELCAAAKPFFLKKGDELPALNVADEVVVVRSGVCAAVVSDENGKSMGIYIAESGYVANVMRIAGPTERYGVDYNDNHGGLALTDCALCAIPLSVVRRMMRCDPDFAELILVQVTDHYKDALTGMRMLHEASGEERIRWLFGRIEEAGGDPFLLTHETIARILGMNRVSVTRLMKTVLAG